MYWHSDAFGDSYVLREEECTNCQGTGAIYTQGRREKYDGECFDKPVDNLLESYCIRDVEVCAKLYLKLCNEISEKQFSQESVELEHKVAAIIAEQERNGFKTEVHLLHQDGLQELETIFID